MELSSYPAASIHCSPCVDCGGPRSSCSSSWTVPLWGRELCLWTNGWPCSLQLLPPGCRTTAAGTQQRQFPAELLPCLLLLNLEHSFSIKHERKKPPQFPNYTEPVKCGVMPCGMGQFSHPHLKAGEPRPKTRETMAFSSSARFCSVAAWLLFDPPFLFSWLSEKTFTQPPNRDKHKERHFDRACRFPFCCLISLVFSWFLFV